MTQSTHNRFFNSQIVIGIYLRIGNKNQLTTFSTRCQEQGQAKTGASTGNKSTLQLSDTDSIPNPLVHTALLPSLPTSHSRSAPAGGASPHELPPLQLRRGACLRPGHRAISKPAAAATAPPPAPLPPPLRSSSADLPPTSLLASPRIVDPYWSLSCPRSPGDGSGGGGD